MKKEILNIVRFDVVELGEAVREVIITAEGFVYLFNKNTHIWDKQTFLTEVEEKAVSKIDAIVPKR